MQGLNFGSNMKEKNKEEYAIEVNNVSKSFRIPHEKRVTVYDNLVGCVTGKSYSYEAFEALKDVSFNVKKGETFGIIGRNGSGKSTMLKILANVLTPDNGYVITKNKIAPFLELGVGFQPELTAVENVYLYGAIMGLKRAEMDTKIDYIFEFSELEKFKDTQKSGMYARLAFSTAISTDPDILLIDEALSVGDEAFQKKCAEWIENIKNKGRTIVFVSHDLNSVKNLCSRCLLLNDGKVSCMADTETVIAAYRKIMNTSEDEIETAHVPSNDETDILHIEEPAGMIGIPEQTETAEPIEVKNCMQHIENLQAVKVNETTEISYDNLLSSNVHIGEYTYGNPQIFIWTDRYHVHIGKFCSIDDNVKILVDGDHRLDWVSTFPFGHIIPSIRKNIDHHKGKGDVIIGNDVFIGYGSIVHSGVKIGDGAVVGAGSVVTEDVDNYEVVTGNPAKHVKYRFSEESIEKLMRIKWWDWDIEKISENIELFESQDINSFISKFIKGSG
ncbi:Chloramphenicol acetyltransferase [Methanosarcina mazei Tuc01]|uniref:Chloramphenicol acetyltransferase n=1 Tax=Methanosarcina mazei Tuc01 TaxID=1236903 RepID=M1PAP3_METMZ|nr:Chloramphenicol acetyltransferase [Methanosarcina mazei Tuc01]